MCSTTPVSKYCNFVRAGSSEQETQTVQTIQPTLTGEEARRLYLEEIKDAKTKPCPNNSVNIASQRKRKKIIAEETKNIDEDLPCNDNDLFVCVQKNDVHKLKRILDKYPEKIGILDNYGWNLLMIACQANSIKTVEELLKRGISTTVRDKAGNSANSLVIKNKNYVLADILLKHRETNDVKISSNHVESKSELSRVEYMCEKCNKTYPDEKEHLSSTIHNITASKNIRVPAKYVIPRSNRGYQLMLKGGWDSISGLGRDGSGKKYPIKTVQKKDRKGLGLAMKKDEIETKEDLKKYKSRRGYYDNVKKNRCFEINFRREFY